MLIVYKDNRCDTFNLRVNNCTEVPITEDKQQNTQNPKLFWTVN